MKHRCVLLIICALLIPCQSALAQSGNNPVERLHPFQRRLQKICASLSTYCSAPTFKHGSSLKRSKARSNHRIQQTPPTPARSSLAS